VNKSRGGGTIQNLEKIQGYAPKRVLEMREVLDDKDVDAVVVATPEHWHALATVWACQAVVAQRFFTTLSGGIRTGCHHPFEGHL
jgi:hypothetical protein